MYICICKAVKDKDIREAVCCGKHRMRDLCQSLGVATQCGVCKQAAKEELQKALEEYLNIDSGAKASAA